MDRWCGFDDLLLITPLLREEPSCPPSISWNLHLRNGRIWKAVVNKGKPTPAYKIKHAHILLQVDVAGPHREDLEVAGLFNCHRNTVANVRQRFVEHGLEAALERKKRATPPVEKVLDGRQEARLIALSCSLPPEGRARWSLRLLADELVALEVVDSISYETVRQTLKKTN